MNQQCQLHVRYSNDVCSIRSHHLSTLDDWIDVDGHQPQQTHYIR